jgi:signal transduction histidine kinase
MIWLVRSARVVVVVLLLAVITAARLTVNQPSLAIFIYALIPIVLAAFWFQLWGVLITAAAASLLYMGGEFVVPSPELAGSALWVATANRSGLYFGVAVLVVLVVLLLRRERRMVTRVKEQQDELDELESLRAALTPPDVPLRPQLEVATSSWSAKARWAARRS